MNTRGYVLTVVIVATIAASAGAWLASTHKLPEDKAAQASLNVDQVMGFHGSLLKTPRQLAIPADLNKTTGSAFNNADIKNHWSLLFFGYTSCPDICPTTLSTIVEAKKKASNGFPQVYFVSVDPQRDTLKKLASYTKYFDKDFIGVTGDLKMLKALTLQLGVVFSRVPSKSGSPNDYLINHSSALMLVNPKGQLSAIINPPLTSDSILKAIKVVTQKN